MEIETGLNSEAAESSACQNPGLQNPKWYQPSVVSRYGQLTTDKYQVSNMLA